MGRIATYVPFGAPIHVSIQRAQLAERAGCESVWVNQLPDTDDAAALLTAYACATSHVGLATGALPIYSRHPTGTVQMAATLDAISHGRFLLGLGVGHQVVVEQMWGLCLRQPVQAMREYLTIVRTSLRDGRCNFKGAHFTARWTFTAPRRSQLPIVVAGLGPQMIEMAGELADGVLLWLSSPAYVHDVVIPRVRAGRQRAGLSLDGFEIIQPIPLSLTTDAEAGRERFRRTLSFYASLPFYRRMLERSGFGADLLTPRSSDRMVDELSGIGSESTFRAVIDRYRDAGCTLPTIWPLAEHSGAQGIEATIEAAAAAAT